MPQYMSRGFLHCLKREQGKYFHKTDFKRHENDFQFYPTPPSHEVQVHYYLLTKDELIHPSTVYILLEAKRMYGHLAEFEPLSFRPNLTHFDNVNLLQKAFMYRLFRRSVVNRFKHQRP